MTVSDLEKAYQRLRDQLLHGELDEERFRAAVEQLYFEDEAGNRWKIGWYTGKWYRYDQGQWIQNTPRESTAPSDRPVAAPVRPAKDDGRQWFAFTPCLVIVLVGLLLVASVLLVFGWNTDWWQKPPDDVAVADTTTQAEDATAEPTPTPVPATATSLPTATPAPSDTPSPTATRRPSATPKPMTPTSTPTQTSTPTATATRVTPRAASSATARPTATPSISGQIYFPVFDPSFDRRTYDIYVLLQ